MNLPRVGPTQLGLLGARLYRLDGQAWIVHHLHSLFVARLSLVAMHVRPLWKADLVPLQCNDVQYRYRTAQKNRLISLQFVFLQSIQLPRQDPVTAVSDDKAVAAYVGSGWQREHYATCRMCNDYPCARFYIVVIKITCVVWRRLA